MTINNNRFQIGLTVTLITVWSIFSITQPALAHHPTGGGLPGNLIEGFLSGLGHPVIGIDHLAFIVASGLIAVSSQRGWLIPTGVIIGTMMGTGVHLQGVNIPFVETLIAASVLIMGILLVSRQTNLESRPWVYSLIMAVGSAIAGIFHGYAYGEAIIGAEMTPLIAYLAGFSVIQLLIAVGSYKLAQTVITQISNPSLPLNRLLGCGLVGMGLVFITATF
jgi:urease accessory protein